VGPPLPLAAGMLVHLPSRPQAYVYGRSRVDLSLPPGVYTSRYQVTLYSRAGTVGKKIMLYDNYTISIKLIALFLWFELIVQKWKSKKNREGLRIIKEHMNDIISIYFNQEGKKHPGDRGPKQAVNNTLCAGGVPSSV